MNMRDLLLSFQSKSFPIDLWSIWLERMGSDLGADAVDGVAFSVGQTLASRAFDEAFAQYPLDELAGRVNELWTGLGLGFCQFQEQARHLEIVHQYFPFDAHFPDEKRQFGLSLLRGFYWQWFSAMTGDESFKIKVIADSPSDCMVKLGLSY
jgi:hypothetical protein